MNTQKGYVALLTVLILSSVTILVATTASLLAIGQAQSSLALTNGENVFDFTEGCTEDALLKAQINRSYRGGTVTLSQGTCIVTVTRQGNIWTVIASSIPISGYKRTVRVVMRRTSGISVLDWKEI